MPVDLGGHPCVKAQAADTRVDHTGYCLRTYLGRGSREPATLDIDQRIIRPSGRL